MARGRRAVPLIVCYDAARRHGDGVIGRGEDETMGTGDEAAFLAALTQAAPVWRQVAGARAAARLLAMAATLGPVRLATGLLTGDLGWDGFMALSVAGRLDASVEAILLRPEFAGLFDAADRQRARRRLAQVDYRAPWDTPAAPH